jgi:manganese transport protein
VALGLLVPTLPNQEAFYIALGILGATVMPHNLYLHTALVQTRDVEPTSAGRRQAIRYNTTDTVLALGAAFFVNAAILVVAAAVFHRAGLHEVSELQEAHRLLAPLLGAPIAATAFAVALLASGQSSTITGTLAGQIVMEGFLRIRIRPWLRRLITRLLAIGPAVVLISISGGKDTVGLLVFSQVVLSMQLSFAIFPLMMFTSDRKLMGEFANPLACGDCAWPRHRRRSVACTPLAETTPTG